MASYFRQVPNFAYVSRNSEEKYISDYTVIKNLFKRGKIREDIFGNLAFFEKYKIIGDERPDNVAYKIYGDETLDWVVLLSNNILNIQSEWPMTQYTLDKFLLEKYGSYDELYKGIHHHETTEIKNSLGITVLRGGIRISPTWSTNGNFISTINSKILSIASGNRETATQVITVILENSILDLKVGNEVIISNISESQYNGKFTVTKIYAQENNEHNIDAFEYELPFVPNVADPTLSNPRQEEVSFVVDGTKNPSNAYYYEYWDDGLGYSVQVPSSQFVKEVTNYEYEIELEEQKRNIFVLKPRYLSIVFDDMKDIMTYKNGGVQYRNPTLKKGDNIRLYE